jgi:glycosyltransferase involved in cell wall biosynthesis
VHIAVYHNLPSGGAKRAMFETVRRLSRRHTFDVYTFSSADHEFADLRPYVRQYKVYDYEAGELFGSPFGRLNMLIRRADIKRIQKLEMQIAAELEAEPYDALFVNPCRVEVGPSILRYSGLPSVYYCQEPPRVLYESIPERPYAQKSPRREALDRIDPLRSLYFRTLKENDRQNFYAADQVLVNSQFMKQSVDSIYTHNVEVCYLGTDVDLFCPQNLQKQPVVLSVGSLTPLKNFDFLLKALATIPKRRRPPLWIASNFQNPPEKEYLENLARELQVEMQLLGNISDDELVRLYNTALVTIYAPIREPFGLVPLESMACGTPVVAVAEGGMQETILDGETGFLVQRSPESFAEALLKLYENPELAEQMGAAGRQHVLQNWTWDKAAERLEHYFACAASKN